MVKLKSINLRYWDLPAATLLTAALLTVATRLVATRWTPELSIIQTLVVLGVMLGFCLGLSRFSSRLLGFLTLAYGFIAILWQTSTLVEQDIVWAERIRLIFSRLGDIFYILYNDLPLIDSLLFVVLMSFLFWALSVYAGYTLVHDANAWGATLPAGLAIIVIHVYDPLVTQRVWYLAAYLFFAIVLAARCAYLLQRARWEKSRTSLPPQLGLDFIRTAIFATLALVILAWTAPVLADALPAAEEAFRPVQRAWLSTRERFSKFFISLTPTIGFTSQIYGDNTYLGTGIVPSDRLIFNVRPPENLPPQIRLYWRAKTYDLYENGSWSSTISDTHNFNPEREALPVPKENSRWSGTFEVISAVHMGTLLSPPQPVWVSRSGQVEYASNPDGSIDLNSFRSDPSVSPGELYRTQSTLSRATIAELRAAGTDYPEWVTARYLQVPENITPRTLELAQTITRGQATPYDKALVITEYLRENITYVTQLDQNPPSNQELLDWFLFDYQKGFCNYYASAQVIMLRSLGIPARWSTGYAQGDKNEDGVFVVRQRNAHSWPEVYFPGFGWVEFEPTASQPDIARLPGEPLSGDSAFETDPSLSGDPNAEFEAEMEALRRERGGIDSEIANASQQMPLNVVYWFAIPVLGIALILLGWAVYSRKGSQAAPVAIEMAFRRLGLRPPKRIRAWSRWSALPPMVKAYLEINAALTRLGHKPVKADTPTERAESLTKVLPTAREPVDFLVAEYQIEIFSKPGEDPANLTEAQQAAAKIRSISWKALFKRWFSRLQKPNQGERRAWQ